MKALPASNCAHCDLPVPAGLLVVSRREQFCCSGCETAYQLIHGNGLDSFYRIVDAEPANRNHPVRDVNDCRYGDFDQPIFQQKYCKQFDDTHNRIEFAIEGMHCGACIWLIEKLPTIVAGVTASRVHWGKRSVTVDWLPAKVALSKIAVTLNQLGYPPSPLQTSRDLERWKLENRKQITQIGIAAACAGNNMIISLALYLGMYSHMTFEMTQLMRFASAAVGLVALIWPGRPFLKSALAAIKTRTAHMDLPIALALLAGTSVGLINVFRGTGEIYFDTLSVLIVLLLFGRWIQFRQQSLAANSVELLNQLTPRKTKKVLESGTVEILVDLVQSDDHLLIETGDLFPADGEIIDSGAVVDESILTGESNPVQKSVGEPVYAGTTNLGSTTTIRVTKHGSLTRIGGLVELVELASSQKPKLVLWANQIGGYFVIAVTMLALLTIFWWLPTDLETGIERAVALLVVACPCALALATPLTIAVALGRAAKRKIMVKGGDVLQSLQTPGMIWLDKTGTLTDGNLKVGRWFGDTHWLLPIAALEAKFAHPVAESVVDFSNSKWLPLGELMASGLLGHKQDLFLETFTRVFETNIHAGLGVSGSVGKFEIVIGNEELINQFQIPIKRGQLRIAERIVERGGAPCWFAVDGVVVGIAEVVDAIRTEARPAIDSLKRRGWEVGILSGDHQGVVNRVGRRLGIDARLAIGGVTPEEKLSTIESTAGTVVMVGDGVNDSAALAAADVGISVKNGAEASLSAADVYFARPGLAPIIELLQISNSSSATMRVNLAISLIYNLSFAVLAFLGYINPLVAAVVMPISSLTVVAIAMSPSRFKSKSKTNERAMP